MLPSAPCAATRSGVRNWTFAARTRADIAPPPSTRLIETAKLNDSDSQASLADLLTF
jgi:hypothetical protein